MTLLFSSSSSSDHHCFRKMQKTGGKKGAPDFPLPPSTPGSPTWPPNLVAEFCSTNAQRNRESSVLSILLNTAHYFCTVIIKSSSKLCFATFAAAATAANRQSNQIVNRVCVMQIDAPNGRSFIDSSSGGNKKCKFTKKAQKWNKQQQQQQKWASENGGRTTAEGQVNQTAPEDDYCSRQASKKVTKLCARLEISFCSLWIEHNNITEMKSTASAAASGCSQPKSHLHTQILKANSLGERERHQQQQQKRANIQIYQKDFFLKSKILQISLLQQ